MRGTLDFGSLTLQQKVGQLFFIGIGGPEIDAATRELLDGILPGGICLFSRNIREARQTRDLLDGLRRELPITPFLSVDQEGGLVDRLRRITTPMAAAGKMRGPEDAARLGRIIGETLSLLGFNMDFAPVVDVVDEERSRYQNGLLSRAFGHSKEDVVAFSKAFLSELQLKGIIGCVKHFPGLGASRVDSHEELPSIDTTEKVLASVDLFPYCKLGSRNGTPIGAIMAAHAAFPGHPLQQADQNGKLLPSSLSYNFVTKLLRGTIGFDGLVITDDLEMGAIVKNYGIGDACKIAVNAGVDMLAVCADPNAIREGYDAVLAAVDAGEITEERMNESLERIARVKAKIPEPAAFDKERLARISVEVAEFNTELGN